MHYSRAGAALIDDRLDAERYAPEQVENLRRLRALGARPLGTLMDPARSNYGVLPPSEEYVAAEVGIGLIRGGDLDNGHVIEPSVWAPRTYLNPRGRLHADDVLILAKGACIDEAAGVGLVTARTAGQIFNGTSYRVRLQQGDPAFLVAYCMTGAFLLQKRREISNTGVSYNSEDAIKAFLIPSPDLEAQRYIGSRVRQAQTLRDLARMLSADMADSFRTIHQYSPDRRLGSWRQGGRTLSEERLDATFYAPPAVQLVEGLRLQDAPEVAQVSILVKDGGFDTAKPISYFEIGGLDISTGCAWPTVVPAGEAPSRAQRAVRHWDILVGTVRPERKNVGIVPPSATGQLVATSGVAVLRAGTAERAAYLWGFLRSDAATEQLMRWNTGAAYPAIDDDVPPRVLMPAVTDDEMRRLGARWMRIPMLHAAAKALVDAARLLVEALIERKVSEAELMTASKDPHADRALLSRLRDDGLDGTGEALFPDLDALAELIAEASVGGAA